MGPSTGHGPHPIDPGRWPARLAAVVLAALLATLGLAPHGAVGTRAAGGERTTAQALVHTPAAPHLRTAHSDHGQAPRVHEVRSHPGTPTTPPPAQAFLAGPELARVDLELRAAGPSRRASKRPSEHLPYRGRGPPPPAGT